MHSQLFFSFMTALLICMALIPPLRALGARLHMMDAPGARKVHTHPVPRVGGIAFCLAACLSIFWWAPWDKTIGAVLTGSLVILIFGAWDDRVDLGYRIKLTGQLLAALVIVAAGDLQFQLVPFTLDTAMPAWIGMPVTLLFLVGVTNAVNLTDGLDGLAGGLSFLTLCGIAYLAHLSNNAAVLLLAAPFLGALLGFLRYNTYPARIFMGDAGSQLLGFITGVAAILLTDSTRGPFSAGLILFLLGLPFLDTIGVTAQRLYEGRSPFVGDRRHIHHKLLALGFSHYQAVTIIYAVQAGMVMAAYFLRWQSDAVIIPIYLAIAGTVLVCFVAAGRHKPDGPLAVRPDPLSRAPLTHQPSWLSNLPIRVLAVIVPGFLIGTAWFPEHVPVDVGYLSLGLFCVVLVGLAVNARLMPYFVRGGLYVGSTCLLYASEEVWRRSGSPLAATQQAFFVLAAAMVLLGLRFGGDHRFKTTPLDYLVGFLAVAFPLLPEMRTDASAVSLFAAKLLVLFFSFELLLHASADRMKPLGLVSLWILLSLGVRAWL